jgi:predicted RNA-binding Zn ribbon-like protein
LLTTYSDLISWSQHVDLLSGGQAERFLREAGGRRAEAATVHKRAIALRETLYRIFLSIIEGRTTDPKDLESLNSVLSPSLARLLCVIPRQGGFGWDWQDEDRSLDPMLWPIARSVGELLTAGPLEWLKQCAGCGWLFLDGSKNRTRRWCDMRVCGNRAKARRHYARQRKRGGGVQNER